MKPILFLLSLPTILILGPILRGWVLSKLWLWFIVTSFHVQPLAITQCIGLSLIIGFLTKENIHTEDTRDAKEKFFSGLAQVFLGPLFVLAFAYIISLFL